jgi:hypothetical protein
MGVLPIDRVMSPMCSIHTLGLQVFHYLDTKILGQLTKSIVSPEKQQSVLDWSNDKNSVNASCNEYILIR